MTSIDEKDNILRKIYNNLGSSVILLKRKAPSIANTLLEETLVS